MRGFPATEVRPAIRPRAAAVGRPATDPACAGCPQLGTLRALRRAGLAIQGGIGCDAASGATPSPMPGRWAAVTGVSQLRARGARALLAEAGAAGAALLVVADRAFEEGAARLAALASSEAARVLALDPGDLAGAERVVAGALGREPGVPLVLALSACVRGAPGRPALAVAAGRCNRCGACLGLACPGIHDPGGEAMAIDPAVCRGCGRCAPLCRSRAIAPAT